MDKPTPPEPQPYWNIDDYKRVHAHKALLKHGEAMAVWGAAQERARLLRFLQDDAAAITYQSLGQYRSALIRLAQQGD